MSENEEVQEIFPVRMSSKGNTFDKDFRGIEPETDDSPKDSSAPAPVIDSEQPPKQSEDQLPGSESVVPQTPDDPKEEEEETTTSTSAPSPTSPPAPPVPPASAAKASKSKSAAA